MQKKSCKIGGQAVLEGVMMRGEKAMATAVRSPEGEIVVESERFTPLAERSKIYKIPIIRGIVSFASSMVMGIKTLNRSSEVYAGGMEDEEPSKFEKWLAKKFKIDLMNVLVVVSMLIGILLAVGLFVVLPHLATQGLIKLLKFSPDTIGNTIVLNLIAGVIRIIIFVTYILLISKMKDIKRLFMYHGAEHKVISCYESGLELNVKNAQKMTTVHDRCGTTFIFIIMVFSIIFFSFDVFSKDNVWLRILIRIVFIPLVAGISYELLKIFAKYDNFLTKIFKAPGLLLQKLTTKQPDDDMVEVSLKAFNTVAELQDNPEKPTEKFVTYTQVTKAVKELMDSVGSDNEAELIYMHLLELKKHSDLYAQKRISSVIKQKAEDIAKKRIKGAPLQYILGSTCFYGYDFVVDQRVLIPRFDTENLVKKAIELAKKIEKPKALDLMTGSGAIAVSIKKNVDCQMTATDISKDALEVAKINAEKNDCEIEFINGSLFAPVKNRKFDIICCNPPYIPSKDISDLDIEVADYEPITALDGGIDGLDFYKDVASKAHNYLNEEGFLLLEVGINQADKVKTLLKERYAVTFVYDVNNPPIARVVVAKLKK